MTSALQAVRDYWEQHATALRADSHPSGSREFFAQIKAAHDQAYGYANRVLDLPRLRGRVLLELGCGIGLDTMEFARNGAAVTTVDVSPTCIGLAQRLLRYHDLTATFAVADAEHLPYPENHFDVAVARGIFMFTPDDRRLAAEILRVLKPGGLAHVLLHYRYSWYVLLAKYSRTNLVHELADPPINRLYSGRDARRLLARFSSNTVFRDRVPSPTHRHGALAHLYNRLLVPLTRALPISLRRALGYYIIVNAVK